LIPTGEQLWIADAHRIDRKRFVVQTEEKLTAFLELEICGWRWQSIKSNWRWASDSLEALPARGQGAPFDKDFSRSENFWLQNVATLRHVLRKLIERVT
jgi:hypothetical protein